MEPPPEINQIKDKPYKPTNCGTINDNLEVQIVEAETDAVEKKISSRSSIPLVRSNTKKSSDQSLLNVQIPAAYLNLPKGISVSQVFDSSIKTYEKNIPLINRQSDQKITIPVVTTAEKLLQKNDTHIGPTAVPIAHVLPACISMTVKKTSSQSEIVVPTTISNNIVAETRAVPSVPPQEFVPLTKLNLTTNSMINVKISNGILSDPNGPIKIMSTPKCSTSATEGREVIKSTNLNEEKRVVPKQVAKLQGGSPRQRSKSVFKDDSLPKLSEKRRNTVATIDNIKAAKLQKKSLTENSLLCEENLDVYSEKTPSNSTSSNSSSNGTIFSSTVITTPEPEPEQPDLNDVAEKIVGNKDNSTSSSSSAHSSNQAISDDEMVAEAYQFDDDPIETIKWKDGIGFLQHSDLHFQFNEFGLVEVVNDVDYEHFMEQEQRNSEIKPLYERQPDNSKNRLQQMIEEKEIIYKCQRCYSYGIAKDFYTQDFCSVICFNEMNKLQEKTIQLSSVDQASQLEDEVEEEEEEMVNSGVPSAAVQLPSQVDCLEMINDSKTSRIHQTMSDSDDDNVEKSTSKNSITKFCWNYYLANKSCCVASKKLFNPYNVSIPHVDQLKSFRVGDKLEAIDPDNQACISVCTVVDKKGFRVKIHFDGYPKAYDFWTNSNSLDLLPPGFCAETFRVLRPPLNYKSKFDWRQYVSERGGQLANSNCFAIKRVLNFVNPFKVGMKLEADDLKNSDKICVATVGDVMGPRLLIHFDGWNDVYDYWVNFCSPYIHPVNWHKKLDVTLTTPPGIVNFSWSKYLVDTNSIPAPKTLFCHRKPLPFRIGMKLEALDNRVPFLIRPATVVAVDDYEIRVHYDGWPDVYGTWFKDDSSDIYPVKYSQKNGHEIEFPPNFGPPYKNTCGTDGCRGLGNALNFEEMFHRRHEECPYDIKNYLKTRKLMNRLEYHVKQMKNLNEGNLKRKRHLHAVADNYNKGQDSKKGFDKRIKLYQQPPQRTYLNAAVKKLIDPENTDSSTTATTTNQLHKRISISKSLLIDYGPRLEQAYELWRRNSTVDRKPLKPNDNPMDWPVSRVSEFINSIPNCMKFSKLFLEHEVDGCALLSLTQNDLCNIFNIKLGPAIVIYNQIVFLREECFMNFIV